MCRHQQLLKIQWTAARCIQLIQMLRVGKKGYTQRKQQALGAGTHWQTQVDLGLTTVADEQLETLNPCPPCSYVLRFCKPQK